MPRVAVLFAGQIRSFKSCWPSIYKHIILNFEPDVDIFMHLWEFGSDTTEYNKDGNFLTKFKLQNDECSKEYVIEKSHPTKIVCDKWTTQWEDKIMKDCNGYEIINGMSEHDKNYAVSCMCMYYKIMLAYDLMDEYAKENNVNYDLIIRARLDFKWFEDVPRLFELDDNQLGIVNDNYARHNCNDKFFMGNKKVMNEFCHLPFELYKIWCLKCISPFEGQEVNKWKIKNMNLSLVRFGSQETYEKYVGSKRISIKNKTYIVNNCLTELGCLMCEIFLGELGICILGTSKVKNEKFLKILSAYDHFKYNEKIESIDSTISRVVYVNGSEGIENIGISTRLTEYIGLESNLPESLKTTHIKQKIFIEDDLKDVNCLRKICNKIYQKKSIGVTKVSSNGL